MKLWALNVCVACILAGALDLFLPRQGSFKSIKTVLALYILVSVVSPAAGADWAGLADLSFESTVQPADYSDYVSGYACQSLARQIEERLAAEGIEAEVDIEPGGENALPAATICTDRPDEALEFAKELLGETACSWQTAPPNM